MLPAKGGGGGPVHLTPAQQRALNRAVYQIVRYVIEHGWGWWALGASALTGGAWALWNWWPEISQWLRQ